MHRMMLIALLVTAPLAAQHRAIVAEATVGCTANEAYAMWTTPEGVARFFAPAARIDARPGGEYTIVFDPRHDREGRSTGTRGAHVLDADPGRLLSFEWITFIAGKPAEGLPPAVPRAQRDVHPLPTWVTVTFHAVPDGATRVRLSHLGFPPAAAGKWNEAYHYFDRAWRGVLQRMADACAKR